MQMRIRVISRWQKSSEVVLRAFCPSSVNLKMQGGRAWEIPAQLAGHSMAMGVVCEVACRRGYQVEIEEE